MSSPLELPSSRRRPSPPGPGTCRPCRPRRRRERLPQQLHLGVVGRDDDEVRRSSGRSPAVSMCREPSISARDRVAPPRRVLPVALVLDRQVAHTGPERRRSRSQHAAIGLEPALVERLRDEPADVRVHPPGPLEEDAAILGDRRRVRRAGARAPRRPRRPGASPCEHLARAGAGRRAGRGCARTSPWRARPRARPGRPRRRRGSRASRRSAACAKSHAVPADELVTSRQSATVVEFVDPVALVERLRVAAARLLAAAERRALLGAPPPRPREQVVDRLVARRGDADALARAEQCDDQPRRRPRLAGAGRALDEEMAAVEREQEPLELVEVVRLKRRRERRRPEHRLESRIAPVAGEQRAPRSARARPRCAFVSYGPPGMSACGSGTSARLGPRLSASVAAPRRRALVIVAGAFPCRRIDDVCPASSLCSWGGNVNVQTCDRLRPARVRRSSSSAPIASASSTSSSGVISHARRRTPTRPACASRRW